MKLNEQRKIFKLNSKFLKKNKWNLAMTPETARIEHPDMIVALGESQLLRWLDELTDKSNANWQIAAIKNNIKIEKRKPITSRSKTRIREFYKSLFDLQFQPNYIELVLESASDYDRANKGFTVNGIRFKRLLGTNGGIKNSTVVYINETLYPEIKKRIDNGRNMEKALVPAKLEAYQALTASGSIPIPEPEGIIVVNDCITHFKENVITITDEGEGEPILKYVNDFEIEHNNSDGFGLMLPSYAKKVNEYLTGKGDIISGMNTRYAWNKGMLYSFPFIEFAEKIAGTYEITDAWGTVRDVRKAEVILTVSMLKLWDSYNSWEDYYKNCQENHYQFSAAKTTELQLENERTTNYQFLQSYDFTDEELAELCKPTIDEIKDVCGMDFRKSIVFKGGANLNQTNWKHLKDEWLKALMIEPALIDDPYIRTCIYNDIKKKIANASKGTIKMQGNYALILGDPFALAQSMFGLTVTGLLKAGEVYHKYFYDRDVAEIVLFRAPMTCHNNIRKVKVNHDLEASYWFRYITTALIYNAWDSTAESLNGADFDGDANFCFNHPILLEKTKNSPTIICMQRKAEKKVPTEEDIISSNKLAFNDDIGAITNRVTAMFDVQAGFAPDSPEYKELEYRIMCGQHYQQCSIDRCKGIIAKPMPEYWYRLKKDGEYTPLQRDIVADKKPYFMQYIYPQQKAEYEKHIANSNTNARITFGMSIEEIEALESPTQQMKDFVSWFYRLMPLGVNDCVVNRICRIFENEFKDFKPSANVGFDYTILKSNVGYTQNQYRKIQSIFDDYKIRVATFMQKAKTERIDKETADDKKEFFKQELIELCESEIPNAKVLCDIVLDLCYGSNGSKSFAWDVCGKQIIDNLLEKSGNIINIPMRYDKGEFELGGSRFHLVKHKISEVVFNERIYFE